MRIQIEPTSHLVTLDGVRCRIWNGVTDENTPLILYVHRIGLHPSVTPAQQLAFEVELEALPAPQRIRDAMEDDH